MSFTIGEGRRRLAPKAFGNERIRIVRIILQDSKFRRYNRSLPINFISPGCKSYNEVSVKASVNYS